MLTVTSRRDFLKAGALCIGGVTLADVLRLQARAGEKKTHNRP